MKKLIFAFFIISSAATFSEAKPVTVVDNVDLNRYAGAWYEIASIPQFFQRKCVAGTVAEYEVLSNETVRVVNSCMTKEGERISSEGRATLDDENVTSKLKVTFAHIGGKYIYLFGGKYWIIYLDRDYKYAIVGHPTRRYGWILSRKTSVPTSTLNELVHTLKDQGYDPCDFNTTPQEGGFNFKTPLCEVVK